MTCFDSISFGYLLILKYIWSSTAEHFRCLVETFYSPFLFLQFLFYCWIFLRLSFIKSQARKKSPLCFSVWSSVTPVFEEPNPSLCRTASKNLQFTWFLMCWWSNNLLLVCMYYCWMSAYDKTCRSGCIMNWVGFFIVWQAIDHH